MSAAMNISLLSSPQELTRTLYALFPLDAKAGRGVDQPLPVVELRVISPSKYGSKSHITSGYFNDFDKLASAAAACSDAGANGVYITPNKINPALFARSPNKLTSGLPSTQDSDILEHTYLLIDIDPVRPSHISASQEEKRLAFKVSKLIYQSLAAEGWPAPIVGDSGNGAHLIYKINMPPKHELIRRFYAALELFFATDGVEIDQKVFNPARIWKLYGTAARKGANVDDRPHRVARLLNVPENFRKVPKKKFEAFAKRAPLSNGGFSSEKARRLDMWVHAHFDETDRPVEMKWADKGRKWVFDTCPFNSDHNDRSAYIVQTNAGDIYAGCMHQNCVGAGRKGWKVFQDKFGNFASGGSASGGTGNGTGGGGGGGLGSNQRSPSGPNSPGLTDLGNAKRLINGFGENIRYLGSWKKWLHYTGARWRTDETGVVMRLAEQAVATIFAEAAITTDSDKQERLYKHAIKSESSKALHAMVGLASYEQQVAIDVNQLDKDPWKLNTKNGTVDLKTGQLLPHSRGDLVTKMCPVEYDPNAKCPTWDKFLHEIMGGRLDLISFLYRYLGYSLTGLVSEQKLIFLYGTGANGKSTFLGTIQHLLGGYAKQSAPELLLSSKNGRHPTEVADLLGARFVVSSEIDRGRSLAEASIKQMTGGDIIKARYMQKDFFEFEPTHKIWLSANHKPIIKGNDEGIWRRMLLVPFEVKIAEENQDKHLDMKLLNELPGLLNRAVAGCLDWQHNGLNAPEDVVEATQEYREQLDQLKPFFDDICEIEKDASINPKVLYNVFLDWCEENHEAPMKPRYFRMLLRERGFTQGKPTKKGSKTTYRPWLGIRLRGVEDINVHGKTEKPSKVITFKTRQE